jgi:hypothetical protein
MKGRPRMIGLTLFTNGIMPMIHTNGNRVNTTFASFIISPLEVSLSIRKAAAIVLV